MTVSEAAARAQVQRLLDSKEFQNSEVLRTLLAYLAEKSIAGQGIHLKEYTVGVEALHRPEATYDPRKDSGVRVQTGYLRQRLSEYYRTGGIGDPILVSLPRGGFNVVFEERPPVAIPTRQNGWRLTAIILSCVLAVLAAWTLLARRQGGQPSLSSMSPALRQLWEPFLNSRRPTVLAAGAPMVWLYPESGIIFAKTVGPASTALPNDIPMAKFGRPEQYYGLMTRGDVGALFLITNFLANNGKGIGLSIGNELAVHEVTTSNVVFLGPPFSTPRPIDYPVLHEVTLEDDGLRVAGRPDLLRNQARRADPDGEAYVIVSQSPGVLGDGCILNIVSRVPAAIYGGAVALTSPSKAADLVAHLKGASGKVPRFYDLVLKVQFKQHTPVDVSYVLHREIKKGTSGPTRP